MFYLVLSCLIEKRSNFTEDIGLKTGHVQREGRSVRGRSLPEQACGFRRIAAVRPLSRFALRSLIIAVKGLGTGPNKKTWQEEKMQ